MTLERSIVEAASRLRRNREPHLVATVVRVCGAGYRQPGARMLLTQFRWITGAVSGGCLTGDIAKLAWSRTRDGDPFVITYDSTHPADDEDIRSAFGLGGDGIVDVMVERAGAPGRLDPLAFADECLRTQRRGAVVTVIRSRVPEIKIGTRVAVRAGGEPHEDAIGDDILRTAMLADARAAIASGESCNRSYTSARGVVDVFVEAILPPPHLFVFGTGHDAVPLVELARDLGWDVSVCTNADRVTVNQRFRCEVIVGTPEEHAVRIADRDRAVAIVMGHDYETDRANLGMLIGSRARYIGVLGPRARTTRMLDELYLVAQDDPRLHSPIGVDLGAETPHELALAIVAEIQAVLHQAARIRERTHVRPMPRITEAVALATAVG